MSSSSDIIPITAPRNVLYLTPSVRLLGARRSLLALVTSLDPERYRPIVCGQAWGGLADELAAHNIPYRVVKTGWWRKGKYFLWRPFAIAGLSSLMRRMNIDLVHCNEIYPNPFAVRAAYFARRRDPIPVITHMRLSVTPRLVRNYDLRRATRIVVPSEAAGRDFDIWSDKSERLSVIYNGVDLSEFRRIRTASEARRQIGVPPDGPLMAAIGQLGPRKGGDIILKALAHVAHRHPAIKVMFVGNPHRGQEEYADELKRMAAESPELKGRVFFFPFTQHILPYYEAADVNLLISRDEGFGRTIIESGSLGVATIGTRIGGIPELITDGKTGLLIDGEDPVQLADAMDRMATDEALRSTMGENVFRHVAMHFSITSHTQRIMDLYDSVLAQNVEAE